MKQTHVAHALLAVTSDSSVRSLAAACGISPSTLSKTISEGRRLDEATLRKLCVQRKGLHLLLAHLRDEIDRAGRLQTEVRIEADGVQVDDDLRLLVEASQQDESLAAILHELATMARRVQRNERTKWLAAEPPADYGRDVPTSGTSGEPK